MSSAIAFWELSADWWHLADRVMLTLLHFLWQGTLIGIACGLLLRCMRESHASSRYIVACVSLLALPFVFVLMFCAVNVPPNFNTKVVAPAVIPLADGQSTHSRERTAVPLPKSVVIDADDEFVSTNPSVSEFTQQLDDVTHSSVESTLLAKPKAWLDEVVGSLHKFSPWATGIYAVGVLMMFMRLVWAVQHGHSLRRATKPIDRRAFIPADLDEDSAKKLREYMSETFVKCRCETTWSKPTK